MRLLLDTNAFLWWRDGSSRLPARVRDAIADPANDVMVSIASLWEIAIKRALRKLRFPEDFEDVMAEEEFALLAIGYAHLRSMKNLPHRHRDPFDRLIIAQALVDVLPVVTNDAVFATYGATIFW